MPDGTELDIASVVEMLDCLESQSELASEVRVANMTALAEALAKIARLHDDGPDLEAIVTRIHAQQKRLG